MPFPIALPCLLSLAPFLPQEAAPAEPEVESAPVLAEMAPIQLGDDEANRWATPFFEGASYDPEVLDPRELFGQPIGSRIAGHGEILTMLRGIEATSARVKLEPYGRSFEGRELVTVMISSPENLERMDEIRAGAAALFDPRKIAEGAEEGLIASQPGIAWMGYGIHGDETSASEAAVPFVYHLAASQDAAIIEALQNTVIVLDPCLNPDGRERIRSMVVQSAGYRANLDDGSMQRGRWPGGRGNHYLFDMNRDWMAGETPETRGRWARLLELPPQLFVDSHEMSGLDTFLFYPQAAPRNAYLPERLGHWQGVLAADASRAFDSFGWGYYTREWADALYPGYSDAWGSLTGAIGMLYEQGRTIGAPLERESGEIVAYRESVHGQLAASMSNLLSFAANKDAILRDYVAHRRLAMDTEAPLGGRAYAVVPSKDVDRDARFLRALLGQGIEVMRATAEFEGATVVDRFGDEAAKRTFPAGTWIVPAAQPQGALVKAYLDFDQRLSADFLRKERESIERGNGSKIYDVTGWDLGRQLGVEGYWIDATGDSVATEAAATLAAPSGAVGDIRGAYAWVVDGTDGRSLVFAASAMESGARLHVADRDFSVNVRDAGGAARVLPFARGSFLVRRHENPSEVDDLMVAAAKASGAAVYAVDTGRGVGEGPDLGGGHFHLLETPKVALFSNTPVQTTGFGHVWSYLDQDLGLPVTLVDAQAYRGVDLAKYNVLIAPAGLGSILRERQGSIADWVRAGGTLITIGSSTFGIAQEDSPLTDNRRRRDVLDKLDEYEWRAQKERAGYEVAIDVDELYGMKAAGEASEPAGPAEPAQDGEASAAANEPPSGSDAALDAWRRQFSPAGVILRAELDPASWVTACVVPGEDDGSRLIDLPVPFADSAVLMSEVRPAVRLKGKSHVRLAGLLWPEARERIAASAWLTIESKGRGQVISFAASPVFRGSWRGTSRLLGNAVLVGPGMAD